MTTRENLMKTIYMWDLLNMRGIINFTCVFIRLNWVEKSRALIMNSTAEYIYKKGEEDDKEEESGGKKYKQCQGTRSVCTSDESREV